MIAGRKGAAWPAAALLLLSLVAVAAIGVAGCQPALEQTSGVVIAIDSPAFGVVDGFELLTHDGRRLAFDTGEMAFDEAGFPAAHLGEHRALGEAVRVTFRRDGDRLVVVRLTDEPLD